MKPRLKPIREQVVVITGASSGIGLTTAQEAARRGASVVLAARNAEDLHEAVEGIRARGGRAAYVVADVSNPDDVERIAEEAVLYDPLPHDGGRRGRNWTGRTKDSSAYTTATLHRGAAVTALLGTAAALVAYLAIYGRVAGGRAA